MVKKIKSNREYMTKTFFKIKTKEIGIFFVFPALLVGMMILSLYFREHLVLNIQNYSWWQFLTSAFVHKDLTHLYSNLLFYMVIVSPLLVFMSKFDEGDKKRIFKLFLFIVLSLPILTSLIVVILYPMFVPNVETSQGSSGIMAAILGMLIMSWFYLISKISKKKLVNYNLVSLLSMYIVMSITLIYYKTHQNFFVVATVLAFLFVSCYMYKAQFKIIFREIKKIKNIKNFSVYFSLLLSPLLFVIIPFSLFPSEIIRGGNVVDIFVHYVGLLYGIYISYFFYKVYK